MNLIKNIATIFIEPYYSIKTKTSEELFASLGKIYSLKRYAGPVIRNFTILGLYELFTFLNGKFDESIGIYSAAAASESFIENALTDRFMFKEIIKEYLEQHHKNIGTTNTKTA